MSNRITFDERCARIQECAWRVGQRMDANETALFSRQLEAIETRLFEVKYPDGHAIELVPLNTAIDPGAETYTYRAYDYVGRAKRVSNFATDFPRVDVSGKEVQRKLQNYGASYGFDLQQLRAARFANFQLEQKLDVAARRVIMRELDQKLWFGDTDIAIYGLANSTLVSPTAVITGTWASATALNILADLQKLINAPSVASKGVEQTTAVVLPHASWLIVTTKFMGAEAPGMTVLDMAKKANPGVAFYESYKLDLADAEGDGPRAVAYADDAEKVEGLVPTEFEVLPAVDEGGQFTVKVMMRTGGVILRYPAAVAYMDGI
jgi:hypothetical protein